MNLTAPDDGTTYDVIIQKQEFDDYGDGIRVERTDRRFDVRINDNAYWRIMDSLDAGRELLFGTRYDSMNKINFFKDIQSAENGI